MVGVGPERGTRDGVTGPIEGVTAMDELLGQLTSKAGLTAAQAQQALDVVLGFLKDKLPPDVMGQLSGLLPGVDQALAGVAGGAQAAAGQATGAAQGAADAAASAAGDATKAAGGLTDSVKGLFGKN